MVRLKVNQGKTQVTIFGGNFRKPSLVDVLDLKWSIEFKLLGIHFDSGLNIMDINYMQALEDNRKVASKWVLKTSH